MYKTPISSQTLTLPCICPSFSSIFTYTNPPGVRCKNSRLHSPRDCRAPIAAQKPSAVLGTCMRNSSFIWATSLLEDFLQIQSRNLHVYATQETYQGFISHFPEEIALFSTWAFEGVVPARVSSLVWEHDWVPWGRCTHVLLHSN